MDRHIDINTPDSTTDGALDWMGLAHALALPGCVDTLTDAFGPRPLLEPYQVAWLGVQPQRATGWEREHAARLGLHVATSQDLAADPADTAATALWLLDIRCPPSYDGKPISSAFQQPQSITAAKPCTPAHQVPAGKL